MSVGRLGSCPHPPNAEEKRSSKIGNHGMRSYLLRSALPLVWLIGWTYPLRGESVEFIREVRPVLARHCFKCHGPDEKARKAKLRLDVRAAALRGGKSGRPALVPGKPEQSELVQRVFAEDEGERMPPAHARKPLSAEQKEILKRWV